MAIYLTEDKIKDIQSLYTNVLNDKDYKKNTKAINKIFNTLDTDMQKYVRQIMRNMWKAYFS